MNHAQTVDHESRLFDQYKKENKRLLHFCPDWDDMAIHAEMDEISACCCDFELESDNILRDEKASAVNERHAGLEALKRHDQDMAEEKRLMIEEPQSTSQDFSTLGAPAHSGTVADSAATKSGSRILKLENALRIAVEYMRSHKTQSGEPYPLEYCEAVLAEEMKIQ